MPVILKRCPKCGSFQSIDDFNIRNLAVDWAVARVRAYRTEHGLPGRALSTAEREDMLGAMSNADRALFLAVEHVNIVGSRRRPPEKKSLATEES